MSDSSFSRAVVSAALACLLALAAILGPGAATGDAASSVRFTTTNFDSPGSDTRSNTSLNGEWVVIKNFGSKSVSLKGWKVKDKQSHTYTFGTFTLAAGSSVKLYTGKGTNSSTRRYWGQTAYIWNNTGDTAYLKTASGTTADTCSTSTC